MSAPAPTPAARRAPRWLPPRRTASRRRVSSAPRTTTGIRPLDGPRARAGAARSCGAPGATARREVLEQRRQVRAVRADLDQRTLRARQRLLDGPAPVARERRVAAPHLLVAGVDQTSL